MSFFLRAGVDMNRRLDRIHPRKRSSTQGLAMSDNIRRTILDLQSELQKQEEQVVATKRLINQLCVYAKDPPMFPDADLETKTGPVSVQRNSFFGRPLTTCVREYLEMRKRMNLGAAPLGAIFDALKEGGYDLETISAKGEAEQKRGVAISLGKNTGAFIRLPTDDWGLVEWYPNVREKRKKSNDNGSDKLPPEPDLEPEPDASASQPQATPPQATGASPEIDEP